MKIRTRLILGFSILLILLLVSSAVALQRMAGLGSVIYEIQHVNNEELRYAVEMRDAVRNIAALVRNLALLTDMAGMRKEQDRIDVQRKRYADAKEKLSKMFNDTPGTTPEENELIARITEDERLTEPFISKAIELGLNNQSDRVVALLLNEVRPNQVRWLDDLGALINKEYQLNDIASNDAQKTYQAAQRLIITIAVVAVLMGISVTVWIVRSITRPLDNAVYVSNRLAQGDLSVEIAVTSNDETGRLQASMKGMVERLAQIIGEVRGTAITLSGASEQLASTAQSMSLSSSVQAASVEEACTAVEQMSSSLSLNAENAKLTDSMAEAASQKAKEGGVAVGEMVTAMKTIAEKIGIVDDIAYQTNLLALNAAIEAARAGHHGKGFAVVAAEVRKLAERSQAAAQEISTVAQSSVDQAVRAGQLLNDIVPAIGRTSDLVQEMAAASIEQSGGVGQINTSMGQLSQVTQQNASASEELAATAEEMSSQAQQLQQLMEFFTLAQGDGRPANEAPSKGRIKAPPSLRLIGKTDDQEFIRFGG